MTGIYDLIDGANQHMGCVFFLQQHHAVEQGAFKRKSPVHKGIVIIIALQHQAYLCANGVMGRLYECGGCKQFFIELNHFPQK